MTEAVGLGCGGGGGWAHPQDFTLFTAKLILCTIQSSGCMAIAPSCKQSFTQLCESVSEHVAASSWLYNLIEEVPDGSS